MALAEYRVWDRTQRVFHWVNFLAVLTLAAIGTVILNASRLVGGPFARWRALLPGGPMFSRRLAEFVKGALGGHAPFYLGHNPLARIFMSLLVLLLVVQGATGIVLAGTDVYTGPLGGTMREWVAGGTHDPALVRPYAPDTVNAEAYARMRAFRAPIVETHELTYFILLALIAIHIAAAVIAEVREGGSIISATFTGRKIHDGEPADFPPRNR